MREKLTVLMYHALGTANGLRDTADPHYAVTEAAFARHLDAVREAGLRGSAIGPLLDGGAAAGVVGLTFDDGHVSNLKAVDALAQRDFTAEFFVNPATVGTQGHLGWAELREMAAAGMSIQSHGFHHRYLDMLSPQDVMTELVDSRREIEDRMGRTVSVFAPPGGRAPAGLAEVAAEAGYRALCTSVAGVWHMADGAWCVPRLAVLASTTEERLLRWVRCDWRELATQRARHAVLSSAKRALGNARYERLRQTLLGDNM